MGSEHNNKKNNTKIIWIDEKIKTEENQNYFKQLKSIFKNFRDIEQYDELDKSFENFYIKSQENVNEFKIILVIVSGRLFGRYIKKLQDNINKIINIPYTFIFTSCNFKKILLRQEPDAEHILSYDTMIMVNDGFYNPGGVYDNFKDLLNEMKNIINKIESNNEIPRIRNETKLNYEGILTFEYLESEEDLLAPALYKEIITNEKITKEDCKNFHNYILSLNNTKLNNLIKNLDLFKYIPFEILSKYWSRCYTIESDFYKILNNKLMKSELSLDYKTFIKMLYTGVEINSLNSYKGKYLYRGSSINKKELEKIKNYEKIGKLSSIVVFSKAFLSFSEDEDEARKFCRKSDDTKSIFFILENNNINLHESNSNIQKFSVFPHEKEILFFPGTSFIIKRIRDINDNNVELILNYNGKFKEKYNFIYDDKEKINDLINNNILTKNIAGKELNFLKGGKYLILEKIAFGKYGWIYKGKDLEKDEIVAIKEINIEFNNEKEYATEIDRINYEVKTLKTISDKIKYSCKIRDKFQSKKNFYIILDYYDDNLRKFRYYSEKFPPNLIKKIFKQLNLVFKELLIYDVIHKGLFPNNILIKYSNEERTNFDSCLTDYGLNRKDEDFEELLKTKVGTYDFWIPGLEKIYKNKSSLLSIGITIYFLYFGDYFNFKFGEILGDNFKIKEDRKLEDLIKNLLKANPDEIITWEEYFNHPFFKQYEY